MSHPVIHLRLGGSGRGTYKKNKKRIAKKIAKEFRRHRYLLDSPSLSKRERNDFKRLMNGRAKGENLLSSLDRLSTLLAEHHGSQTVILIDEYDAPIVDGYLNGYRKKIVSFYRSWLTDALKDTDDLFLSALSGVLRVSQESIFSELNNVEVNTMLDETYGEAFGFTEDETQALAAYVGQYDRAEEMRAWYDGYQSGPSRVYNPWSVIHYLGSGVAHAYWVNTSKNGIIRQLVRNADDVTSLELAHIASGDTLAKPLDMQTVFDDLTKNADAVWPQLYQAGYVTTDDVGLPTTTCARGGSAFPTSR